VIPVITPEEMAAIDEAAPEPVDVLIDRAARAVARRAVSLMGGVYGRRVVVIAGKGNNGNDGRVAAEHLRSRGVRVRVVPAADELSWLPAADLVIDAAYGTGFRGSYKAPALADGQTVLAVDIPSGVHGLTGEASDRVLAADATVTFAALKPGLLLEPGADLAGEIDVADIGLDVSSATVHLVGASDVAAWMPRRAAAAHKWQSAVWIIAGSPGMGGAASLAASGAQRAGAGYVRLSTPGGSASGIPVEVVQHEFEGGARTGGEWAGEVIEGIGRFASVVIGNGLGTGPDRAAAMRAVISGATIPTVVDADGLTALAEAGGAVFPLGDHVVLTPHDGEFARLTGSAPGPDRIAATRDLAARTGAVVLLKGHLTVVAHPDGRCLLSNTGDARLATAGTGDVLAGIIGALLAQGLEPLHAAVAGAFIHGRAGDLGWRSGLVAGDLPPLVPQVLAELGSPPAMPPTTSTTPGPKED
jgi:ADP-dependent NAD(P)H-hydrate dehydratase / NAD(P)H-hydrate epimerase